MAVAQSVGLALRDRRIDKGLRQADLAEKIEMSRGYVSVVEAGVDWTPPVEVLRKWSEALGWPADRVVEMVNRAAGSPDLTDFVKDQARAAVREELLAAMQDPEAPLADVIQALLHRDLVRAIYDAMRTIRQQEALGLLEVARVHGLEVPGRLQVGDVIRTQPQEEEAPLPTWRSKPRHRDRHAST